MEVQKAHKVIRGCLKNQRVASRRVGSLCRPATRRAERRRRPQRIKAAYFDRTVLLFRSAGRRPGRAGRPCHPFLKQALSLSFLIAAIAAVIVLSGCGGGGGSGGNNNSNNNQNGDLA